MSAPDFAAALRPLVAELVAEQLAKLREAPAAELVTVDEYARRRSISTSTVRAAIREGRLLVERIGRAVRVPAAAAIARPPSSAAAAARDARRERLLGGR